MKTLMLACLALGLLVSVMSFAQYSSNQGTTGQQSSTMDKESGKAVTLSGKIGDDGKSFTSDKDGKNWTISNPDAVKGHKGHEVKIKAHENAAANELHVTSVKMKSEKKETMQKNEMQH